MEVVMLKMVEKSLMKSWQMTNLLNQTVSMKLGFKRSWLQIKYNSLKNPIFGINRQIYKSYHSCKY